MSGTAKTNADIRCELSASSIRAILARKLAQVQTRVRPRQSADSDLLNWLVDSERQPLNLMMHITDEEAAELKIWIVKKLENISDADSDVLADYVLALIRVDTEEAELKINAVDSLEDFLKDDTAAFVGDVFHAVRTRSYKPGYVPPLVVPSYNLPPAAPSGPSGAYGSLGAGRGSNGGFQESRKRSYNDHQENGSRGDSHYARGDRQMKQLRRGGRGGRGDGFGNRGGRGGFQDPGYPFPHAASPPLPPTFPNMPMPSGLPFDPNDPMAAIIAMQAMGLPPLPGMPALPGAASPTNGHHQFGGQDSPEFAGPRRRERCRDYDTQGYCARGDSCPYEHGTDRLIAPNQDEYDPKNALLSAQPKSTVTSGHNSFNESRGNGPARGSGRGRGDRGGFPPRKANRAEFSQAGPNYDPSITTIVVEQIPEEKFDEQSVRGFFSEFGNITEVTMQPYKRLSLVKYDNYTGARRAYDSPKVIFDNRFVKVYWYNPNTLPTPPAAGKTSSESLRPKEEEQPFDKEEFERNAMAAQKKLEEKKSQMREMEIKRQALEKQKEELAQKQTEEKRKLLEKLAAKGITSDTTMTDSTTNGTNGANDGKVSAHTKALREKVAELEAEAKSLGLDSALSDYSPRGRGRGRGRGSYRGWEGFAGRGGAFDSPRGRGGFRGRGGGKYNLDNRTKKVAISGVKFDSEKDEALRSYLLGVGEYNAIEPHSKGTDTQIITFKDRPTAESFMYGTKEIPNVGKLEFSWHNAPNAPSQAPTKQAGVDADVGMGGTNADNGEANRTMPMEDYDIAEDYDVADDIS